MLKSNTALIMVESRIEIMYVMYCAFRQLDGSTLLGVQ